MTASAEDSKINKTRPSRRALLAGALGGLGAWAARAAGHADPARAANGDTVLVGHAYTATNPTKISNLTTASVVLEAESLSGAGVYSTSSSNIGVYGTSSSSHGVHGFSFSSYGVYGTSDSGGGVYGNGSSNGVEGVSLTSGASGVYGHNNAQGYGVTGRSNAPGLGVNDIYAAACLGENTAGGIGVWARSQSGVGLYADAIDRTGVWVRSAEPNAAGDSFTIRLNKAVAGDTKVGWFIVN